MNKILTIIILVLLGGWFLFQPSTKPEITPQIETIVNKSQNDSSPPVANDPLTDNFESYSVADLNGQGGWSGTAGKYAVENTISRTGSKAVVSTNPAASATMGKSITAAVAGSQVFYLRASTISDNQGGGIQLITGATSIAIVQFVKYAGSTLSLTMYSATAIDILRPVSDNTWYRIEEQWDATRNGGLGQVRARVNNGAWTAWQNGAASFSSINKIQMAVNQTTGSVWFDDLSRPYSQRKIIEE